MKNIPDILTAAIPLLDLNHPTWVKSCVAVWVVLTVTLASILAITWPPKTEAKPTSSVSQAAAAGTGADARLLHRPDAGGGQGSHATPIKLSW